MKVYRINSSDGSVIEMEDEGERRGKGPQEIAKSRGAVVNPRKVSVVSPLQHAQYKLSEFLIKRPTAVTCDQKAPFRICQHVDQAVEWEYD